MLPTLLEIMAAHGFVHDDDLTVVAEVLNLSRADVLGVASFYHDIRRSPAPPHRLALCRGEACQARGAETTMAAARERWDSSSHVEVAEVFCLGNCALGPAGTLDGRLHAALTPDRVDELTSGWSS